eukprot:255959-Amphidinium_carterae.5
MIAHINQSVNIISGQLPQLHARLDVHDQTLLTQNELNNQMTEATRHIHRATEELQEHQQRYEDAGAPGPNEDPLADMPPAIFD